MLEIIKKSIQVDGSLPNTTLTLFLQSPSAELQIQTRPMVLICPGGGYRFTSDREADPLALAFLSMGYHAAVLRYSCAPARYPTALTELASCVKLIREHASQWAVEPDKLFVLGCSAGGHLAANLGTMWNQDFLHQALEIPKENAHILRPDGLILCYPVITSGEFAHQGSFEKLLADDPNNLRDELSLEKRVTSDTPPVFIWHTFTDETVPVENSLLFVSALRRANIPTEFHMYAKGCHGLSLANQKTNNTLGIKLQEECTSWINLVHTWLEGQIK